MTTGLIFIMMLILMWQTAPLRYGLIGVLFKEFKWTFLIVWLQIGVTALERGIKLAQVVFQLSLFSELSMWQDRTYLVFYYLRFLLYPFFYGVLIAFCFRIVDPTFYKPNRWLK